jgi:hypothetical protein
MDGGNIEFDLRDHDSYPMLLDIQNSLPLGKAKRLLRLFASAVRGMFAITLSAWHHILIYYSVFQNWPGWTPWAKIRSSNKDYIPCNYRLIDAYLNHWSGHQKLGKTYALMFCWPANSDTNSPWTSDVANPPKHTKNSKGKKPEMSDISEEENDVEDDTPNMSGAEDVVREGGATSDQEMNMDGEVPTILSEVGKSKRQRVRFLRSLAEDREYQSLCKMLEVASVRILSRYLFFINYIL